jgi:hypothetical protein
MLSGSKPLARRAVNNGSRSADAILALNRPDRSLVPKEMTPTKCQNPPQKNRTENH